MVEFVQTSKEDTVAYIDFPEGPQGIRERKQFWLSDEGIQLIAGWRREGIDLDEIALRYIGISDSTMRRWTKECAALEQALRMSQDTVNAMVEASLLKRALGYDAVEDTWELVEGEMRKVRSTVRHIPPDTKACMSWLFSRRSDRWRAQQEPIDASSEAIAGVKEVLVSIARASEEDAAKAVAEGAADGAAAVI